uniref:Myb-like domain-containing protein n=1 Tax=Hyaloperonospora arabidopsidis (strain Emoy2) TaxID=559515 RepID=M4BZL4_HYAAE
MISPRVMSELHQAKLVPTESKVPKPGEHAWSSTERHRFWEAIQRFPHGPWTDIAAYVGSKSTRQAMTHAQKLRLKLRRWKRRVRSDSMNSTGSTNSTASTLVLTPSEEGRDEAQSPILMPPTISRDSAVLEKTKHVEEEETDEDVVACYRMDIEPEVKDEVTTQCGDHRNQVQDAHDDWYLEQLLSDIEPVLEHVAHFTNAPHGRGDCSNEQAMNFMRYAHVAALEHKIVELSTCTQQRQDFTLDANEAQYSWASALESMQLCTPTGAGHQHSNYHLL